MFVHISIFVAQTEEEYCKMMESDEIKAMKQSHMDFRESLERDLLNTMKDIAKSRNVRLEMVLSLLLPK